MSSRRARTDGVLVSWIAVNNDPFERDLPSRVIRKAPDGNPVPGPTLGILFHEKSPYRKRIKDVVLLYRRDDSGGGNPEPDIYKELAAEIAKKDSSITIHGYEWKHRDPTDHKAIFEWLDERMPEIRRTFADRELVIHLSPGTPSMHTIWVLMVECGFVDQPYTLVKSYRDKERGDRPPVVEVKLDLGTFYKRYRQSRPREASGEDQRLVWDRSLVKSPALAQAFDEATRFARLKIPVLILGERGTGKTTLASWIRMRSPFRNPENDAAWPSVPCGQYTSETMRSELFGHKKGAFTGAERDHPGLLEKAHGDTLFLDEVGDVSRDLQRLLIRALEEKRYQPLGSDGLRTSDFRLLTATNKSWEDLNNVLDHDFLDRISPVAIRLPPLREVREDLPWLWDQVLQKAAERAGLDANFSVLEEGERAIILGALKHHPLPGNLRDLFQIAYRFLGARTDPDRPLGAKEAANYALKEGLKGPENYGHLDVARAVAIAYGKGQPLDGLLSNGEKLKTKEVLQGLQQFLGEELEKVARGRKVSPESICDVNPRTLKNWQKP